MIKKVAFFAIMGVFVAAFAMAQTEVTTTQQPSETTVITKDGEIIGTIEKVDVSGKTLIIKSDAGDTKTYTFTDQTTFIGKEKTFTVRNLKPGDAVVLQANPENVVTKVRIKTVTVEPEPDANKQ